MKAGDIALAQLQQADGQYKLRPVLLLKQLPPFGDWLVCGISAQVRQAVPDFDELVQKSDSDFPNSGLHAPSVIRLGFLATLSEKNLPGTIGSINPKRYQRLLKNLTAFLEKDSS